MASRGQGLLALVLYILSMKLIIFSPQTIIRIENYLEFLLGDPLK